MFTILESQMLELRQDRPALLLSSTSWTADEDFSLLLTALDMYQETTTTSSGKNLPKLLVIITGKGSLRARFEKEVKKREATTWRNVCVRCHFLPAKDYPTLLGCADLGVSLHTSSSGRDLPMKVVDMFGCGVPVLAKEFGCIDELVKHGENGLVFADGKELGSQIIVSNTSPLES
jgi:beta-1,4-mannosyltransferase